MSAQVSGNQYFSPAIFFIAFREALEASLVIGVLLASIESLINQSSDDEEVARAAPTAAAAPGDLTRHNSSGKSSADEKEAGPDNILPTLGRDPSASAETPEKEISEEKAPDLLPSSETHSDADEAQLSRHEERRLMVKNLRHAVFLGAGCGMLIAFAIGAAFLAVFYTQANDLYGKAEELWEGIFNLVAAALIIPMALALLRLSKAKRKWAHKLQGAFNDALRRQRERKAQQTQTPSRFALWHRWMALRSTSAWIVFTIPFITTLREALEGVVFIGGVSLGLPATSIPLPAILGLAVGFGVGVLIWRGGPRIASLRYFLVASTAFLLIIAVGMATRAVYYLQFYRYVRRVGDGAAESGDGPGSYDATGGIVAHFNFGNPEHNAGGTGWGILSSLCGWLNTWTYGTVLTYNLVWLAIAAYLSWTMLKDRRVKLARSSRTAASA